MTRTTEPGQTFVTATRLLADTATTGEGTIRPNEAEMVVVGITGLTRVGDRADAAEGEDVATTTTTVRLLTIKKKNSFLFIAPYA